MTLRLWLLAILLAPTPVLAQESVPLTLPQAIDMARQHSHLLEGLQASQEAAEFQSKTVAGSRWPSVDVTASYIRQSDVPELPPVSPNLPNNYRTRISASVPLFTGWELESGIDAATSSALAAKNEALSGGRKITLETKLAYWRLLASRENRRALKQALESYEAHLRDAQNRKAVGMAAQNELLAVTVERDQAHLSLLNASNSDATANADLVRLTGLPSGTQIQPTDSKDFTLPAFEAPESLARRALDERADRKALLARIDAARSRTAAARGRLWPKLSLAGGYDFSRPNRRIIPIEDEFQDTWDVSLNLSLNLFEGGRTRFAMDQAGAELRALESHLKELDEQIQFDVTTRYGDLQTAVAGLDVARKTIDSAGENLRVTHERYRSGLSPSSELLDAEAARLRADLVYVDALARVHQAAAALEYTVGQ